MDVYMRSVGFVLPKHFEMDSRVKKDIMQSPDKRIIYGHGAESVHVEHYKMYGGSIGILARGRMDKDENVIIESYEPYVVSDSDLTVNKYLVEYADNQPVIVFEDIGTGNELVFMLQNKIDFYRDEKSFIDYGRSVEFSREKGIIKRKVNISALSVYGTVILPVYKEPQDDLQSGYADEESYYKSLVLRFKEGDDEAGEILQLYAEQTSETLNERLMEEDLLSVVEGYFLPMEDNETDYSLLGTIKSLGKTQNEYTGEEILKLTLDVTGSRIQLFINSNDIVGHPMPGMRFMGVCRLIGSVII